MSSESQGYLVAPYLSLPYLGDSTLVSHGLEFTRVIQGTVHTVSLEWLQETAFAKNAGVEATFHIEDLVTGKGLQFTRVIESEHSFGIAFTAFMVDKVKSMGLQSAWFIEDQGYFRGLSFRIGKLRHTTSVESGYMSGPYLAEPYLAPFIQVALSTQFERLLTQSKAVGLQFQRKIEDATHTDGLQFKRKITVDHDFGLSFDRLQARALGLEFTASIYNNRNLRILADFPSRGVDGFNWTTNSQEPGDFHVNNLNTDIVEQVYRSLDGTTSGVVVTSDTGLPQGAFVDTVAILNHNLTTSASIVMQGSNDIGFGTTPFALTLFVIRNNRNIYWISPTLPMTSYKYYRFLISDPTNPSGYIEIGTILYGTAIIMTDDNIVDHITRRTIHFADKIATEGYTNVSNDRALKYAVGLEFRNLNHAKSSYLKLRGVFDSARTSLKCLWIPTPRAPERFAVFGKLADIPSEDHNYVADDADYIDISLEIDESL